MGNTEAVGRKIGPVNQDPEKTQRHISRDTHKNKNFIGIPSDSSNVTYSDLHCNSNCAFRLSRNIFARPTT